MQISSRIMVACLSTAILLPGLVGAADTDAQIKARQALEKAMGEMSPPPAQPTPAPATAPQARPAAQPSQVPVFQPAPAIVAKPAVKPAAITAPEPSGPEFAPLPANASNPNEQKAVEALRQKITELQEPVFQPLPKPNPSAPIVTLPPPEKLPVAEKKSPPVEKKPVVVEQKTPPAENKPKETKSVATAPNTVNGFTPMKGPPTGLSADQEMQLQQLLQEYRADKISPDEYHSQRAKIIGQR